MTASRPPRKPQPLFPGLRGRGATMAPERIARHQRQRLMGAMVVAVGEAGYERATIGALVGLAGVSKRDFYHHFESKQECFEATFDEIVELGAGQIAVAYRSEQGLPRQLEAGLEALAAIIADQPAATHLVVVDSLALGAAGMACRERAAARFEAILAASFAQEPQRGEVSELELRVIVAGLRRVAYRALRTSEPGRLTAHVPELVGWALCYQRPADEKALRLPPPAATAGGGGPELDWEEPPGSERARCELSGRERILRAVAQLAADGGYGALSIPAISAAAGTSNEAYYANFAGKDEAFLAAFEALAQVALRAAVAAFEAQERWADGVAAGIAALLEHIAGERLFARLAFVELPAAGPASLERIDATIEGFTAYLDPGTFGASVPSVPSAAVIDALGGGIWALIQHEVALGREAGLPRLAAQVAAIALAPFGVE